MANHQNSANGWSKPSDQRTTGKVITCKGIWGSVVFTWNIFFLIVCIFTWSNTNLHMLVDGRWWFVKLLLYGGQGNLLWWNKFKSTHHRNWRSESRSSSPQSVILILVLGKERYVYLCPWIYFYWKIFSLSFVILFSKLFLLLVIEWSSTSLSSNSRPWSFWVSHIWHQSTVPDTLRLSTKYQQNINQTFTVLRFDPKILFRLLIELLRVWVKVSRTWKKGTMWFQSSMESVETANVASLRKPIFATTLGWTHLRRWWTTMGKVGFQPKMENPFTIFSTHQLSVSTQSLNLLVLSRLILRLLSRRWPCSVVVFQLVSHALIVH